MVHRCRCVDERQNLVRRLQVKMLYPENIHASQRSVACRGLCKGRSARPTLVRDA